MKNGMYDTLKMNLDSLTAAVKRQNNLILKADTSGNLHQKSKDVESLCDYLADMVSAQFKKLNEDYSTGAINYARYLDYLRIIRDALTQNVKLDVPALNVDEIIAEIRKHGLN